MKITLPKFITILIPKRRYFKHAWKIVIIICSLAFIIGQFAIYLAGANL